MPSRLLTTLLLALALAACGKKEEPQATPPVTPAPAPQAAAEAAKPVEAAKPAEPAAPPPAAAAPEAAGGALAKGEDVFKKTCVMCHKTGAAGAPLVGNKDEWGPRIAQGKPTLYEHALKGYTGKKGMMPPKGGNPSLSDDDVKAGVDYMVGQIK